MVFNNDNETKVTQPLTSLTLRAGQTLLLLLYPEESMTPLGIHHLAALEVDPVEFVTLASQAGCQEVSLFVQPVSPQASYPLVNPENFTAVEDQLRATGTRLANIECFLISPATAIESFRPALERGARLGARSATALLYDADAGRITDNLDRLCEMAAPMDLRVGVEFLALTPAWNTLAQVTELVTQLDRPNLGLGLDLLHLVRSGTDMQDVAALPPGLAAYAQLCDGTHLQATPDYAEEASSHRLAPGEGCFPVQAFLKALPAGTHLEIEVPQRADRPALERIRQIVDCTREQLRLAGLA